MELDGVFKSLLLLKKKKYAGVSLKNFIDIGNCKTQEEQLRLEVKGLDLVRRDWSGITKTVSEKVLRILLYKSGDIDEVMSYLETVNAALVGINQRLNRKYKENIEMIEETPAEPGSKQKAPGEAEAGEVVFTLKDFVIKKQLNKKPSEYKDAGSNPHVKVARWLLKNGQTEDQLVNHFIPYVIVDAACLPDPANPTSLNPANNHLSLADQAMHPDEFAENCSRQETNLDLLWYKTNQIIGPVERFLDAIEPDLKHRLSVIFQVNNRHKVEEAVGVEENNSDTIYNNARRYLNTFYKEGADISPELIAVNCSKCLNRCPGYMRFCAAHKDRPEYSDAELTNRVRLMLVQFMRSMQRTILRCKKCNFSIEQIFMERCCKCNVELTPETDTKKKYSYLFFLKELIRAGLGPGSQGPGYDSLNELDSIADKKYETKILDAFKIYAVTFPPSNIHNILKLE